MIQIRVKLFTRLKEMAAREELSLPLARGSSCEEAISRLKDIFGFPELLLQCCLVAINGVYTPRNAFLSEGDELALLPPVSGG